MSKKGQIFSTDLVLSIIVFTILFIFVLSLWNLYSIRLHQNTQSDEMQLISLQITDLLTKTQGYPHNWQQGIPGNITIGLSSAQGDLSQEKIDAFIALNYTIAKELFNIERFEYKFEIANINGELINSSGIDPNNSIESISIIRHYLQNDNTRKLTFILWRENE
jgi:hypothetical protein